ncbi:hypothetical protein GCM10025778_00020 [Paeniglutamicibacter antarcticus]|uniref:Uncharacterized protein n=1 Tax=Paeniglutamicibacter antarcticus TaxID=494023 RepID=A0ABP9TI46_9MICC
MRWPSPDSCTGQVSYKDATIGRNAASNATLNNRAAITTNPVLGLDVLLASGTLIGTGGNTCKGLPVRA